MTVLRARNRKMGGVEEMDGSYLSSGMNFVLFLPLKTVMCRRHYHGFTYIHALLIDKDLFECLKYFSRRREYGTYLATARRHRRRLKMQKRD